MVRIINYKQRESQEGRVFFTLEVQGGVELIRSNTTGQHYASSRKASIASTFDEETCKALIGTEMPGEIRKEECEAYDYTVKETGEVLELKHRYVYVPENEPEVLETPSFSEVSEEGLLEMAD